MTRRFAATFLVLTLVVPGAAVRLLAHEGHDHKVMGTVTMAAANQLTLRDKDGKDVTIQVTADTKVKAKAPTKVADIRPGTRVVITAVTEKDQLKAKLIEVGVVTAAK